jgi:hypothetical protein
MRTTPYPYVDDSSESEGEPDEKKSKSTSLSLTGQWQQFSAATLPRLLSLFAVESVQKHYLEKAFYLHWLGLSIFNRVAVRAIYRQVMPQQLPPTEIAWPVEERLITWITKALEATIDEVFLLPTFFRSKERAALKIKFATEVANLAKRLAQNKVKLLRCLNNPKRFFDLYGTELNALFAKLSEYISTLTIHSRHETITAKKLAGLKSFKDYIFPRIKAELVDYAKRYDTLGDLKDDLEDLPEDEDLEPIYRCLLDVLPTENSNSDDEGDEEDNQEATIFLDSPTDEVIATLLDEHESSLVLAECQRLVDDDDEVGESITGLLWQFAYCSDCTEPQKQAVRKFLKIESTRYQWLIADRLARAEISLLENLSSTKPFAIDRSILNRRYAHRITGSNDLFAGVRLSNRSQQRLIRNMKDTKAGTGDISTALWQFPGMTIQETQTVTSNLARTDVVEPKDSYPTLATKIEKSKLKDKKIAQEIRHIVHTGGLLSDQGQSAKLLFILAYMLFGVEVARNPACIIVHQMMLDLIINGKLTWKTVFNDTSLAFGGGGKMPMSMDEKAVQSARYLQNLFNPFMPHHYFYPGSASTENAAGIQSVAELMRRQAWITSEWLKMQRSHIESKTTPDDISLIENAISGWYPNN